MSLVASIVGLWRRSAIRSKAGSALDAYWMATMMLSIHVGARRSMHPADQGIPITLSGRRVRSWSAGCAISFRFGTALHGSLVSKVRLHRKAGAVSRSARTGDEQGNGHRRFARRCVVIYYGLGIVAVGSPRITVMARSSAVRPAYIASQR